MTHPGAAVGRGFGADRQDQRRLVGAQAGRERGFGGVGVVRVHRPHGPAGGGHACAQGLVVLGKRRPEGPAGRDLERRRRTRPPARRRRPGRRGRPPARCGDRPASGQSARRAGARQSPVPRRCPGPGRGVRRAIGYPPLRPCRALAPGAAWGTAWPGSGGRGPASEGRRGRRAGRGQSGWQAGSGKGCPFASMADLPGWQSCPGGGFGQPCRP